MAAACDLPLPPLQYVAAPQSVHDWTVAEHGRQSERVVL